MNRNRPADITALSLFFALGAVVFAVAGATTHYSGTLHEVWRVIPALTTLGTEAVSWLVCVTVICAVAAVGLWRCSYWGFLAACLVLILGMAAHFFRALVVHDWPRLLMVAAVGLVIAYYLRSRARIFVHPPLEANATGPSSHHPPAAM